MKRILYPLLSVCVLLVVLAACTSQSKDIVPSPAFAPYVSAYTGGIVSQSSGIRVELAQEQPLVDLNQELEE